MRASLLIAATLWAVSHAAAQDGKECFSEFTKYNVCEQARDIQRLIAASFPMKMNANITLSMAAVAGPRVILTAIWHTNKLDLDDSLRRGAMSLADLEARMGLATGNSVCSQDIMAAFIRLGGQVQYLYKTEDGYVVLAPVVTKCAESQSPPLAIALSIMDLFWLAFQHETTVCVVKPAEPSARPRITDHQG
jgi:hypothetical protein